jgi:transmembrane sensor
MNEELLTRFLTKTCTTEELLEVEKWISADQANADWLFEMESIWSLKDELRFADQKQIETAYHRFVNAIDQKTSPKIIKLHFRQRWMKYAVSVVIVCLLAANIYQMFRDKSAGIPAVNTIEVPLGQRVSITLSDGTKVWLNAGSILNYPSQFDQANRNVRLDGEGYFEVVADEKHPFIVQTSMLDVKVLGTRFNIQAYPDEDIAVSLVEGKLRVQAGQQVALMSPNELVTYSDGHGLQHIKNKDIQHTVQWTLGEFMFIDEELAHITRSLERYFDVTINIDTPELAEERFSCRTQQGATLEQVLDLLKRTKKIDYTINGKKVHIQPSGPRE